MTCSPCLFAIVLAAGRAERFGAVKQLATLDGEALVTRAVRTAERVCGVRSLLVVGYEAAAVHAASAPLRGFLVCNDDYAGGMASSLRCGVAAVRDVADGVLILLADQPLVSPEHLNALVTLWLENTGEAVASRYAGVSAVPAIFPRRAFAELEALQGDQGARALLAGYGERLRCVNMPAAEVDIDQPADLEQLRPSGS